MAGDLTTEQLSWIESTFEGFLLKRYLSEIRSLLTLPDPTLHYSIDISLLDLLDFNPDFTDYLVKNPLTVLPLSDEVLARTLDDICRTSPGLQDVVPKPNVHSRFSNFLQCPELVRHAVPQAQDTGRMLQLSGTVIRTSVVKMLEMEKDYACTRCGQHFTMKADFEQFYSSTKPSSCPNTDCKSYKFTPLHEGKGSTCSSGSYRDYQEVKIQEQVQKLEVGKIPRSMWAVLTDDLVDSCKPGDDVTMTGVVRRRWQPLSVDSTCDVKLALEVNHVTVNNEQKSGITITDEMKKEFELFWSRNKDRPLEARNEIVSSFCPQVFGLYVVKLCVCLALIGGVEHVDISGTRIRGESHLLLVGDPGTGKSQFLKFATKLMPRAVLTTGIGSTSAGLTVTAVKDSGEWQLEAGALVLSDGGLCCIDEFNSIREHDRASIHEAMEQQTISVAKAGLVCKLNTKCTILAATNPKGQYDQNESLSVNVALASPLLSRFDLVLVLMDAHNEEWDLMVSSFIIKHASLLGGIRHSVTERESSSIWALEKLRHYFCFVKSLKPVMTEQANMVLSRYYQLQRQADGRNVARTTIRLLESIVRLAQAHAKLMCQSSVGLRDAVVAVTVMECSMQGSALLGGINVLHSAFPQKADEELALQENLILQKLGLEHLLTTSESSSQRAPAQGGNNEDGSYSDAERQYEIMDDVEETREQSYEDFSDFG